MDLKTKLKLAHRALNKEHWFDLAEVMRSAVEENRDELTYQQCFTAAQVLHDKDGFQQQSLELAQLALIKDPKRVEALEVMYFIFFSSENSKNLDQCHGILELLFQNSTSPELTQKYNRWNLYLANKEGNSAEIVRMYQEDCLGISEDIPDTSQAVFGVTIALLTYNMVKEARELVSRFFPEPKDDDANQLNCHAKLCAAEGTVNEALEYFSMVESLGGEHNGIEATWNKSLLELSIGHLESGWSNYEVRWEWDGFPTFKPDFSIDKWEGHSLAGKAILLWGEQGIGDELLFSTLIPEVLKLRPERIGLAMTQKILPVMRSWFPEAELFPLTDLKDNLKILETHFDYHLPLGSLPLKLKQFSAGGEKRYLGMGPSVNRLKESLRIYNQKKFTKIVGLSWRSGVLTYTRVGHYISADAMANIIEEAPDDVLFVSLQYSLTDDERSILEATGQCFCPKEDLFNDVLAQSYYVRCCDLIITSSSVCFGLSGICNVPTITWGPRGMWTLLGSQTTAYPWFPNVHYIRCETAWDMGALLNAIKKLAIKFYTFRY